MLIETRSIAKRGLPATIQKWEKHWSSALTNDDIEYMMTARCNMVRLPIGYYTLGPDCCVGTPFEGDAAEVYKNAWKHVLDICGKLRAAGIGVLIDLHAAPGGANGDSHSGTSSSKAALWGNKANLALSRRCHVFIAQEVAAGKIPNCIGLELCNESAHGAKDLYKFYDEAIRAVAAVDSTLPVYVSDAWDLAKAVQWAAKHNAAFRDLNPVVVDTHTYYTFAAADRACAPQTILDRIPGEFARAAPAPADVLAHGATPLFVGEYSCVLDGQTWARAPAAQRDDYVRQLGTLQLERAFARALGAAFWTLKMEWMDGGEWGFVAMTKAGAIGAPELGWLAAVDVEDRAVEVRADKAAARADALARFRVQCQRECPKRSWAPALFTAGFAAGWEDALAFWDGRRRFCLVAAGSAVGEAIGADKIGDLDAWILKRLRDVGPATGTWEWERGFRVAVDGAEDRLLRAMSSCASSRSTLFQNK